MGDPFEYRVTATNRQGAAVIDALGTRIEFDGTADRLPDVPGPTELFVASFGACMLKNVERFSNMLPFTYRVARIEVAAIRETDPPRITEVQYELVIDTDEPEARVDLLRRNIEKFGTIYNTIARSCEVTGEIRTVAPSDHRKE